MFSGGRVLQIPRAKVEDAGRYTCVAVNEAGEDSLQYDVRVLCEFVCFCLLCILSLNNIIEELMCARCRSMHLKDYQDNQKLIVLPRNSLSYTN